MFSPSVDWGCEGFDVEKKWLQQLAYEGSIQQGISLIHFLVGCHERKLDQMLSDFSLVLVFF